ncbi:heparinase II/III family protein [Niabella aquatica]
MLKECMNYAAGFFLGLLLTLTGSRVAAQQVNEAANYLTSALRATGWKPDRNGINSWRQIQRERTFEKIAALPDSIKHHFREKADRALSFCWQALPASSFLEYKETGNRIGFEKMQLERRANFYNLVIAYLLTHEKKYLPPLVNGLWATLEESTWEIPAIVALQKAGADLPDPYEPVVGLVNAETAVNIAMVQFLLHEQIEKVSPVINKRITRELKDRFLDPYLKRNDFWWMGFSGQRVNNWNAWINTNVLYTALLAEENMGVLQQLISKVFLSADYFINQYPADGGCDEGSSYWNEAAGKLIQLLSLANSASNGALNWNNNKLLLNMGSYIYKMHIDGSYFVNFADAVPQFIPDPESVYLFGEMFGNKALKQFAAYLLNQKGKIVASRTLVNFVQSATLFETLAHTSSAVHSPLDILFPDLQVAIARNGPGAAKELFLAVQGGHNEESHNHNDVGNFILYIGGKPVIVDAGVGTYTAQTFSNRRYELWNMQSQWHNCPTINGIMQHEGRTYRATSFAMNTTKNKTLISLDIAQAYPAEAAVRQWKRSFSLEKDKMILTESYDLVNVIGTTCLHFLTVCNPQVEAPGTIVFYDAAGERVMKLKYNASIMKPGIEQKIMDDPKMINSWGKALYRIGFLPISSTKRGTAVFEFEPMGK